MDEKKSASDEWHCFVEELWMIFSSATLCGENMKSASAAPTVSCCCGNLAGLQVFWRCLQTMHRTCVLVHKRPSSAAEQIICCQWNSQGFLLGHTRLELFLCRAPVYITCLPCGDAKSLGSWVKLTTFSNKCLPGVKENQVTPSSPFLCFNTLLNVMEVWVGV